MDIIKHYVVWVNPEYGFSDTNKIMESSEIYDFYGKNAVDAGITNILGQIYEDYEVMCVFVGEEHEI